MITIGTVASEIDIIYKLDCLAYPEEMTDKEWYFRRYDGRERVYVYSEGNKPLAYAVVAKIKKELADAIANGVLDGDVIVSNNMFRGDGTYIYLASYVVAEEARHSGIFRALLNITIESHKGSNLYVLANEHTAKAFKAKGFEEICDNGHYKSFRLEHK